jgi:hypothetical protein
MITHDDYHFSITVHTEDIAILYCLRGLTDYSERSTLKKIAWGNTKGEDWKRDGQSVTFHFSSPSYRNKFTQESIRVLPAGSWSKVRESDNDPAVRQKKRRS